MPPPKPKRDSTRGAALIQSLQARFGDQFENLFEILGDIAEGTLETREPTGLDGTLDRISKPSIKERSEAIKLILSYGLGNPVNRSQVQMEVTASQKWDPDLLTMEELNTMSRLARKAEGLNVPALPTGYVPPTVEGEFNVEGDDEDDEDDDA